MYAMSILRVGLKMADMYVPCKRDLDDAGHTACQTRHSKRDYLGDYWAILRLFLRMRFRQLFELPQRWL